MDNSFLDEITFPEYEPRKPDWIISDEEMNQFELNEKEISELENLNFPDSIPEEPEWVITENELEDIDLFQEDHNMDWKLPDSLIEYDSYNESLNYQVESNEKNIMKKGLSQEDFIKKYKPLMSQAFDDENIHKIKKLVNNGYRFSEDDKRIASEDNDSIVSDILGTKEFNLTKQINKGLKL